MSIASALTWPPRSARRDLDLLVGQRRHVEELRNPLAPFDFDEQHLAATGARVSASAAAIVDLPVPPLPVTKCRRAFDNRDGQPTLLPPLDVVATPAC